MSRRVSSHRLLLGAILLTSHVASAAAQDVTPFRVADINLTGGSSNPGGFRQVGSYTYFTAEHEVSGRELWRTDGTAAGTALVADIRPGWASSSPYFLGALGNTLFFRADDGVHGTELWKTDGTFAGTLLVRDTNPGTSGGYPASGSPSWGATLNGKFYFAAYNGTSQRLWQTDGTEAGTFEVGSTADPFSLIAAGGRLYFFAYSFSSYSLWTFDPATASTQLVRSGLQPYGGSLVSWGSGVGFIARTQAALWQVWVSDGTAGGTLAVSPSFGSQFGSNANVYGLAPAGGRLYFQACAVDYDCEPWVSNGTAAGTMMLKDLMTGSWGSFPSEFTELAGTVYFTANSGFGPRTIWKTDGTAAGTTIVSNTLYDVYSLQPAGNVLFFSSYSSLNGWELWRSDGTPGGTAIASDIAVGGAGSSPQFGVWTGTQLLFSADDGVRGRELWTANASGTSALLADIRGGTQGSGPYRFTTAGALTYFLAWEPNAQQQIWASDGTAVGTRKATDFLGGSVTDLAGAGNNLLFGRCEQTGNTCGLWKTDGGLAPVLLKSFEGGAAPYEFASSGSVLYFTVGGDVWRSDGTAAGTVPMLTGLGYVRELKWTGGHLYFASADSAWHLWRSDGTAAGSMVVASNIWEFYSDNYEEVWAFTSSGSDTFFRGCDLDGCGVWRVSGAGAVSRVWTGYPISMAVAGTRLFILDMGQQLSVFDGTTVAPVAGYTSAVMYSGDYEGAHRALQPAGDKLFFFTYGSTGFDLWTATGTTAQLVAAGVPYPASNAVVGQKMYFSGCETAYDCSLWVSDGTAAGTHAVSQVTWPATPYYLTSSNKQLWFQGDDGFTGYEAWLLPLPKDDVSTVQQLVESLPVTGGQTTSLQTTLEQAIESIAAGHTTSAENQLGAMVNQINALKKSGRLDAAAADTLIAAVQAVRATIPPDKGPKK